MNYFPRILPDELLYSVIARYQSHTKAQKGLLLRKLFGNEKAQKNFVFPCRLDYLITEVNKSFNLSHHKVVNCTLFPFMSKFLSRAKAHKYKSQLMSGNRKQNLAIIKGFRPYSLVFCPDCVENDRVNYGEAYWHISHNFPSAKYCDEHRCSLLLWTPPAQTRSRNLYAANDIVLARQHQDRNDVKENSPTTQELLGILKGYRQYSFNETVEVGVERGFLRIDMGVIRWNSGSRERFIRFLSSQSPELLSKCLPTLLIKLLNRRLLRVYPELTIALDNFFRKGIV